MRIIVLSRKRSLFSTRRLKVEGEKRRHKMEIVDPLRCVLLLKGERPAMLVGGRPLAPPGVVLPRVGSAATSYAVAVVRHFDLMGVPVVNNHGPIARAKDKLGCLQHLFRAGIRVPETLISRHPRDLDKLMRLVDGPPLVMKLLKGTQGTGVIFAESRASIESMLETAWSLGEDIMLQRFIHEARGRDVRALVIDGEVRTAMRRVGPEGEFRSNIHRGGVGEPIRLPKEYERIAVASAKALKLQIAGVDILESREGPMVIEVNASPGFEGLEAATGKNVARMFIESCERAARRRR